jgi:glycosyltransferase involved in cell wall biosynthesis
MTKRSSPTYIAIYLHTLYNGGVERVMFTLIQGWLDRGIAVDLVLDFLVYSPFEKLLPVGARLINLNVRSSAQRLPSLIRFLRANKPDTLLSATHFANETACLATKVFRVNTRLIVSEHTNLSADIRDSGGWARRSLLPWTTKWLYPLADEIVAVSNGVAEDMCRVSGLARSRVRTIYNPIDFKKLSDMAREPLSEPWFAAGEVPVILAMGRLEVQKNFPNLLHAFAEILRNRRARLLILGEGSERERLTSLVAELGLGRDVSLPGFVANPAAYMAKSAIFAMSSSWEGMPVALIEALALGIPVVSTDCPSGPAEVLDHGTYGELVPMNDSSALAEAILRVLAGARKPAADAWLTQFDSSAITDRYLDLMSHQSR